MAARTQKSGLPAASRKAARRGARTCCGQGLEDLDDPIAGYIEHSLSAQRDREEKERRAERTRIEAEEAARRERLEHEAERLELRSGSRRQGSRSGPVLAAGVALLLALGAGMGAVVGFRGQQEAGPPDRSGETNASEAQVGRTGQAAETQALDAKDQALRSQSLVAVVSVATGATNGDAEAAILLALEALPTDMSSPGRPYLFEAEAALYARCSGTVKP